MKKTLLITMLSAALTAGAGVTLNNFNDVNSDNAVDVGDVNTVLGNILGGSKQYFIGTAVDIDPAMVNSLVIEANNGEMPSGKVVVYFRCNAQHFTSSVNSNTVSRKVQVYEPFVPADKSEVKLWYLVGDCVSSNYWSNLPADVGAGPSITPLLPLPDAQYNAKDGTGLISTVIYLPQGGQFKFVDGTGSWADDCQINPNNSYCVLPDDWNTDDWNENFVDSEDSPAVTSRVTFNHRYDDSRRYFINGRELTPHGDGLFTLELQEDESWVITDNDRNNYGAISRMTYRTGWRLEYESYIWQAGNSNGWGSPAAPLYSPYSNGEYSGYMYLNGGFKFRSKEFNWDYPNWGSDGTTNGLQEFGYDMSASEGFYRVDVNLVSMVYYLTPITTVSIIGTANGGKWDTDTDMTFNKSTGAWEFTGTLTSGEFMFRANHSWNIFWGGTAGDIVTNGPQLTITEAGAYHISLSLKCDTRSTCIITKQ
ncbi:MAG: SusF/SusE family outer membrane protein [Muribaculaceae bacterium]|nr:SusF/SusE family outer membrane protein [Muribaculaceae bacterium]